MIFVEYLFQNSLDEPPPRNDLKRRDHPLCFDGSGAPRATASPEAPDYILGGYARDHF